MNKNIFSVVIPYFNSSRFLSTLNNTLLLNSAYIGEVIFIDDCSDVDESNALQNYEFNEVLNIKIVLSKENLGPSNARNCGISLCTCMYIAFLDSDDYWVHNRLELLYLELNKYNFDIDMLINSFSYTLDLNFNIHSHKVNFIDVVKRNLLQPSCAVIKNSNPMYFNFNMSYSEDYDYFIRMFIGGKSIYFIDSKLSILGRQQGSPGGLSSNLLAMRLGEVKSYFNFINTRYFFLVPLLILYSFLKHIKRFCNVR